MPEPSTLFWQPGCTSCLRAKDFLRSHGISFDSINIAESPSGLEKLSKQGIKAVPVLMQGDRFIFAQVLSDIAKFLGIEDDNHVPLTLEQLVTRLVTIFNAAQRYARQIPVSHLNHMLPGRARSYRELAYHIFRIAECFLEATRGRTLTDEDLNKPPGNNLQTGEEIAEYGQRVLQTLNVWWNSEKIRTEEQIIATYFGPQTLHVVLERTTWHSAQHTRQLMMVLKTLNIEPDGPLLPENLSGLPLPEKVWDD